MDDGLKTLVQLPREDPVNKDAVKEVANRLLKECQEEIEQAWSDKVDTDTRIRLWREIFSKHAPGADAWRLFAYKPGAVIGFFSLQERPTQRRRILTEIYEAWYEMAADGVVPGVDRRSATMGAGFLARTRWLLLSAPFRGETLHSVGVQSQVERARQAREEWLAVLDVIDDHPNLRAAIDVEDEAVKLTSVVLKDRQSGTDLARFVIARHVVTRLLLPRFAWLAALRVLREVWGRGVLLHLATAGTLFLAALIMIVIAIVGVWPWGYTVAAVTALLGYGIVALGAALRPQLGWLWLLRQPAGAAVGLLALIALPDWWATADSSAAAIASGILILIGVGYLTIEAGNHGARAIIRRSVGVSLIGFCQAAMVSLIGLRFLFPVFAAAVDDVRLSCWWTGCPSEVLPAWLLLLTATAWSFVAGVFLQITWNDQPITAPLAHISWRRGR